jgi:hypothetical protein
VVVVSDGAKSSDSLCAPLTRLHNCPVWNKLQDVTLRVVSPIVALATITGGSNDEVDAGVGLRRNTKIEKPAINISGKNAK